MKCVRIGLIAVLAGTLAACSGKESPPTKPDTAAQKDPLQAAVDDLGNPNAQRVEAAKQQLRAAGDKAIPYLETAVTAKDKKVAAAAVEILAVSKSPAAVAALAAGLRHDDPGVRDAAAKALIAHPAKSVLKELTPVLESPGFAARERAIFVLRNRKEKAAIPTLLDALLRERHAGVRNAVFTALPEFGDAAVPPILEKLSSDVATPQKRLLVVALGRTRSPKAVDSLLSILQGGNPMLTNAAACALADIPAPQAVEPLLKALEDENPPVRSCAAKALGSQKDGRAVPPLLTLLRKDTVSQVRAMAAYALGRLEDDRAVPALIAALRDPERPVRYHAVTALSRFRHPRVPQALASVLDQNDLRPHVQLSFVRLGSFGVPALVKALRNKDDSVASTAALTLGKVRDTTAVPALIAALNRSEPVAQAAATALRQLTGVTFGTQADAWKKWWNEHQPAKKAQ